MWQPNSQFANVTAKSANSLPESCSSYNVHIALVKPIFMVDVLYDSFLIVAKHKEHDTQIKLIRQRDW